MARWVMRNIFKVTLCRRLGALPVIKTHCCCRAPPRFGTFGVRKLDEHEPSRRPVSFQGFNLSAADEIPPAVRLYRWGHRLLVLLVTGLIVNINVDNDVRGHSHLFAKKGTRSPP